MAQKFKDMLKCQEVQNRQNLSTFYKISFMTGVNLKYKANFNDPIKLINILLTCVSLVGLSAQYCLVWHKRNQSIIDLADPICTANQVWISVLKQIYLLLVQHKCYSILHSATNNTLLHGLGIFDLTMRCEQKISSEIKEILDGSWSLIKRQLNLFAILCLMVCGSYMFSCIFVNYYFTHMQPQNFTLQLPMPALFPMWHDCGMTFPYYPIQYAITGIENYLCGMTAVCFDGLFIITVVHCSALFEILHKLLEHATNEEISHSERVQYLVCCVRFQEQIYRYFENINALYRNPSLLQSFLSMLILCVVMFMATVGLEENLTLFLKSITFFFAASFQIIIYCYNGQKIISQSEKTPTIWYSCSWYNESKQFKYIIDMMVLRSNRTLYLQISDFGTMSHITLLSIFQTTVSYYLLLKNLSGMD